MAASSSLPILCACEKGRDYERYDDDWIVFSPPPLPPPLPCLQDPSAAFSTQLGCHVSTLHQTCMISGDAFSSKSDNGAGKAWQPHAPLLTGPADRQHRQERALPPTPSPCAETSELHLRVVSAPRRRARHSRPPQVLSQLERNRHHSNLDLREAQRECHRWRALPRAVR